MRVCECAEWTGQCVCGCMPNEDLLITQQVDWQMGGSECQIVCGIKGVFVCV